MGDARDVDRAIDAVWRIESARLIAGLARMVRDVGAAEELAQDALVTALERWRTDGVPANPGAWLMQTAKRRAIDRLRHRKLMQRKHQEIGRDLEIDQQLAVPDYDTALDDDIGDDLLRLIFTACHPLLATEGRLALTLRVMGGLTTDEIARAFLTPEPTIAQRIVRAKRALADAKVPFEVPRGAERGDRLSSVLEVIYLIFNEGYSATAGDDWMRPQLCQEALRVGRILAELTPTDPEVHGLVALMEIQASRSAARTGPGGEPILLLEQDRARWDRLLIGRGLRALARAEAIGEPTGPYVLQAAIAACHARALTADATDWPRIVALYTALGTIAPSPAPSPSPWPRGLPRAWRSSTPSSAFLLSRATTCFPRCAAISSLSLGAIKRRRRSSSAPPSSRATRASVPSCSIVPGAPSAPSFAKNASRRRS